MSWLFISGGQCIGASASASVLPTNIQDWFPLRASQAPLVVKNLPANAGRYKGCEFDPWVGKILWRRKWQPPPVFSPGESHEQGSLAGHSPWVQKSWTRLNDLAHMYPRWLLLSWVFQSRRAIVPFREATFSLMSCLNLKLIVLYPSVSGWCWIPISWIYYPIFAFSVKSRRKYQSGGY